MAAHYAGLHKKLKDSSVAWDDRVKLSRFGWISPHVFLPNKHRVLLDWICNALANAERDGIPQDAHHSQWLFLHDALKSQEMYCMLGEGKPVSLRGNLHTAFISALNKKDISEIAIGCLDIILTNEKLRFIQNIKYESFVSLTLAVVELATERCNKEQCFEEGGTGSQILKVSVKCLPKCSSLLHQQQNGKKATGITWEKLLLPCLRLHNALTRHSGEDESATNCVIAVNNFFKNVIFSRDMTEAFKVYLATSDGPQKKDGRLWTDVVSKFMDFIQSKSTEAGVLYGLPVVYSAFLTSFKSSPDLAFAMLQKLYGLLTTEDSLSTDDSDALWDVKLSASEKLLKLAAESQCYSLTEEEEKRTQKLEWFQKLFEDLMKNKRHHPSWYGCLNTIFSLDHGIMGNRLQEVWPCLLATRAQSGGEADDRDPRKRSDVNESRDVLVETIIDTFTKLRQLDKLIKGLLMSILNQREFSSGVCLPASLYLNLGRAFESLTPASTIALWDIILSDVITNHVSAIVRQSSETVAEPPPKKKQKKGRKSDVDETKKGVDRVHQRSEAVATILHCFMANCKMVEAAEVGQIKGQVSALMDKMADEILMPLLGKCCDGSESLLYLTLLLCHGWGEMHLLLRQHTSLMERVPLPPLNIPLQNGQLHYLHGYVEASTWTEVMAALENRGSGRLAILKCVLLWQQAKAISLHGNPEHISVQESLMTCIAQALVSQVDLPDGNLGRRDSLMVGVTGADHQTAILSTILHQASVLLSILDDDTHLAMARLLCQALSKTCDGESAQSGMGARDVAVRFLESEACRESRRMQTAIVDTVGKELNGLITIGSSQKVKGQAEWRAEVEQKLEHICTGDLTKKLTDSEARLDVDQFIKGSHHLQALSHLPLAHLSPSNQTQCMLVLGLYDLYATHLLSRPIPNETWSHDLMRISVEVRRLEVVILKGIHCKESLGDERLVKWFSCFLQLSGSFLLKMDGGVAMATEYLDVAEDLASLWLKKAANVERASDQFEDYVKHFHVHITQCLQKLESPPTKSASLPVTSTMLSMGATLLHQFNIAIRHQTAGTESTHLQQLARDFSTSTVQLLERILALENGQGSNSQVKNIMRASRTLLVGDKSTRAPKKDISDVEMIDDSNDDDKSNEDSISKDAGLLGNHFRTCYQRALSCCSQILCNDQGNDDDNAGDLSTMPSCIGYLATYCSIAADSEIAKEIWSDLRNGLGSAHSSISQSLEGLLLVTISFMTGDDLEAVLQELVSSMKSNKAPGSLEAVLKAWQLLPVATYSDESYRVAMETAPQVMQCCQTTLQQTLQSQPLEGSLIAAILSTVGVFISKGKDLLPVEHALPTMHLCLGVPLSSVGASAFPACLRATFQVLDHLLIQYPKEVLRAAPAFISCANYLMSAVIDRCSQYDTESSVPEQQLIACAEDVQRLLSLIAGLKEDISQFGIYLVADYISGLQRALVPLQVKKPLVEGIYKIVDVCDEKTLTLLHVTLPVNLKEVFKAFYSDYKKHHKYTGHV